MKKFITLILVTGFSSLVQAEKSKNSLMASETVIWAGLDYSLARMIGSESLSQNDNFIAPETIFPGMLEKWNQLFLEERIEAVSTAIRKKVSVDIGGVTERNKSASKNQITLTAHVGDAINEPNITPQDIINEVRSYKMQNTNGLGLVFIVDKLAVGSFSPQTHNPYFGAVYVIFFDVASRDVISMDLQVNNISDGRNFCNFWFGPIKDADSSLGKYRTTQDLPIPAIHQSGRNH